VLICRWEGPSCVCVCQIVCDLETSTLVRNRPELGCWATAKNNVIHIFVMKAWMEVKLHTFLHTALNAWGWSASRLCCFASFVERRWYHRGERLGGVVRQCDRCTGHRTANFVCLSSSWFCRCSARGMRQCRGYYGDCANFGGMRQCRGYYGDCANFGGMRQCRGYYGDCANFLGM